MTTRAEFLEWIEEEEGNRSQIRARWQDTRSR